MRNAELSAAISVLIPDSCLLITHLEFYPHSRAYRVLIVVDDAASEAGNSVAAYIHSLVSIGSRRPQPPLAITVSGFVRACFIAEYCCTALTGAVRIEILVDFCDAEQEYLIRRIISGRRAIFRIIVRSDSGADNVALFF